MISNQRKTNHPQKFLQKQSSRELPPPQPLNDHDHYLINFRKKAKKVRERKATYSLCSIESKPSLSPADGYKQFRRRKVQSIASLDARTIETERPIKDIDSMQVKQIYPLQQVKRIKTIDHSKNVQYETPNSLIFSPRQQKIKECINLMKGVLDDIQNRQIDQQTHRPCMTALKNTRQPHPQKGTVEYYIKNHAKAQNSKALLLRKGKSKSIILISQESIKNCPQPKQQYHNLQIDHKSILSKKRVTSEVQQVNKKVLSIREEDDYLQNINSIQCSPICKVNQSSFMSGASKQSLIRELGEHQQLGREAEKGKRTLKLSNKKIKQIFPEGFFDKRL